MSNLVALLTLGTFDVQRVDVMEDDTSTCFQCVYVDGTSAKGCFIEYICNVTSYSGNLTVIGHKMACEHDINFSNYTIKVYDEESDGTRHTHTPAFLIESIQLGRKHSSTHGNVFSSSTSSVTLFSFNGSPDISSSPNSKTFRG